MYDARLIIVVPLDTLAFLRCNILLCRNYRGQSQCLNSRACFLEMSLPDETFSLLKIRFHDAWFTNPVPAIFLPLAVYYTVYLSK